MCVLMKNKIFKYDFYYCGSGLNGITVPFVKRISMF